MVEESVEEAVESVESDNIVVYFLIGSFPINTNEKIFEIRK